MKIKENINLAQYTTIKLGGIARYFIEVTNENDIIEAFNFSLEKKLPIFVLGGGSNVVILSHLDSMIFLKMNNKGIEISYKGDSVYLSVKAGEVWDDLVLFSVNHGFSGLQALSFIPGTVGASPIQNIGAYGADVSFVIEEVKGFSLESGKFKIIKNKDCNFGYRNSVFKNDLKNKFIIESVVFKLSKKKPDVPNYPGVKDFFNKNKLINKEMSDIELIRKTIIEIRDQKLPNPKQLASAGSFFGNVFVSKEKLNDLLLKFPKIPFFKEGDLFKIPTGFLIEQAGFKGQRFGEVGVYIKNALVLVNYGTKNTKDIIDLADNIKNKIKEIFDLDIKIEPEVI